jgi:hypothetical protein
MLVLSSLLCPHLQAVTFVRVYEIHFHLYIFHMRRFVRVTCPAQFIPTALVILIIFVKYEVPHYVNCPSLLFPPFTFRQLQIQGEYKLSEDFSKPYFHKY